MRRLLVVEDDAAIRDGIVCLLRRNGYAAAAVTDFADVAGQILAAAPDLVLLDLNLPGVDGGFTCREVRAKSQVPIIAVTSRDTDMDELVTLSAGADDFVTAFREKAPVAAGFVNAGVYLLPLDVIASIPPGEAVSIERDVFPELVKQRRLAAVPVEPPLLDMGTLDGLAKMEAFLQA